MYNSNMQYIYVFNNNSNTYPISKYDMQSWNFELLFYTVFRIWIKYGPATICSNNEVHRKLS